MSAIAPIWLSFDLEDSRAFCINCGAPKTLIIDFAAIWDAAVSIDYRLFRHAVKKIARQNLVCVEHAEIMSDAEFQALALAGKVHPDALVVFINDDDWVAPHLFARLRKIETMGASADGFKWSAVRVGRPFKPGVHDAEDFKLHPTVRFDPVDTGSIVTNNYAVSGRALERLGFDAVF